MNPKKKSHKIGLLLSGAYECLFFVGRDPESLLLVAENSKEIDWVKKFLKPNQYLSYRLPPKKLSDKLDNRYILKHSNLSSLMRRQKITAFFGWLHADDADGLGWLNRYFAKNKLIPLTTDFKLKKNFENKLWFDKFLEKNHLPKPESASYVSGQRIPEMAGSVVVQEAYTAGGEGTFILKKIADLKILEQKKLIQKNSKYLVRKFIKGQSFGISLFITPDRIALSAVRLQCAKGKALNGQILFNGIQWLPTSFFSSKTINQMNEVFFELGRKLQAIKFYAFANIDFIIDDQSGEIQIIECNPRLSSSTFQIFALPALISNLKINELLIDVFLRKTSPVKNTTFHKIPSSKFMGATLDINGFHLSKQKSLTIKKEFEPGIYAPTKTVPHFKTADFRKFSLKGKQFILASFAQKNEQYQSTEVIASIISNYELYDIKTEKLNQAGNELLKNFNYA